MSRTAFAPRALACVVGIALLFVDGVAAFAAGDPSEIGLAFENSQAAPHLNAKFRSKAGWIGGDGAQSIDLGHQKTLWLYGDTWVGTLTNGRRSKARIVHNSAGVQCTPDSECEFIIRENEQQQPIDLIAPLDGRGWLWFQAGVVVNGQLYLFMSQYEKSTDPLRPDHQPLGQWLAIIENPHDSPLDWRLRQVRLPFSSYSYTRDLTFGSGAVVDGDYLYVYGYDDASRQYAQNRYLVLARVPLNQIADMSQWRFFKQGRWTRNHLRPTKISDYMAGDISVTHVPGIDQFLMVYTDCDVSNRIVARTAPTPAGPWSNIEVVHKCRDASGDLNLFCYAGKAHPTLSSDGKLVISYLTSSVDTWQVATDSRLYWPMFVTVGVRDARPPESAGTVARTSQPR